MNVETRMLRTFATPGFIAAHGGPIPAAALVARVRPLLGGAGAEPSWIIGDPAVSAHQLDDGGRTLKIPTRGARFYAIRDDHEPHCTCGCGGGAVVTFLLPEEY